MLLDTRTNRLRSVPELFKGRSETIARYEGITRDPKMRVKKNLAEARIRAELGRRKTWFVTPVHAVLVKDGHARDLKELGS